MIMLAKYEKNCVQNIYILETAIVFKTTKAVFQYYSLLQKMFVLQVLEVFLWHTLFTE